MENEAAMLSLLETALKASLGDSYFVSPATCRSGEMRSRSGPDLVVRQKDDPQQVYMVELKMVSNNFDLPLIVANQTKQMIKDAAEPNTQLILATTSRIGNLLRQELDAQNVAIVQTAEPAKLAEGITQVIRSRPLERTQQTPA